MRELIERLRDASVFYDVPSLRHEAATEIERLRELLDRTPIDWDTELNALQLSNDALRAEVELFKRYCNDADETEVALRARVAELEEGKE